MKIVIYLNKERTSTHVIRPTSEFEKECQKYPSHIQELAQTVCPGYYSLSVFK